MASQLTEAKTRAAAAPATRSFTDQLIEPFSRLRSEMDRLFDDFPFRLPSAFGALSGMNVPALEMTETKKTWKITAEVPGMEAGDLEVSLDGDMLRIAGEKKTERDEDEKGYRFSERSYGSFERIVRLPAPVEDGKIKAKCRSGVLTITIPKDGEAAGRVRKIAVD